MVYGNTRGLYNSFPSIFDPLSVSGCKLWLKADAGITKDGSNLVSQWDDQSGQANHVTQATGTNQPLWVDAAYASKPTIRFDGVDNFLSKASFSGGELTPTSFIFIVSTFPNAVSEFLWSSADDTKRNYMFRSGSNYSIYSGTPITGGAVSTSLQQLTAKYDGTTGYIRRDGTELVSGATGTQNMNGVALAVSSNLTEGFGDVDICEMLIYNASLSDADRNTIESYLVGRWGL